MEGLWKITGLDLVIKCGGKIEMLFYGHECNWGRGGVKGNGQNMNLALS